MLWFPKDNSEKYLNFGWQNVIFGPKSQKNLITKSGISEYHESAINIDNYGNFSKIQLETRRSNLPIFVKKSKKYIVWNPGEFQVHADREILLFHQNIHITTLN